jgi:hypothetical protein
LRRSIGLRGVPRDVKSVCPPSRNEPHEFFNMGDMEDTEVCRDDSMEDIEGKWRMTMASPARTEAEKERAPSVITWIRMESKRNRTRDRVPNGGRTSEDSDTE